jgi:hypothetical protein
VNRKKILLFFLPPGLSAEDLRKEDRGKQVLKIFPERKFAMKTKILTLLLSSLLFLNFVYSEPVLRTSVFPKNMKITLQQVKLDPNNISTWFINTGIFNQDRRTSNTPGFEWPKGNGTFAIFTSGLTIAARVNGILRMASGSYSGEYEPGYIIDSSGVPVPKTDSRFKIYSVKRGDSYLTNQDWLNWGQMVPFGAPFTDVNNNGTYEPQIDTPGIRGAAQTIFVCITDGFYTDHIVSEGFGGGTSPLYAELHVTGWGYDNNGYEDMQFFRFNVINKSHLDWNSAYFSIVCDPDLGCADDDYIGCDTNRSMGFCYNSANVDCAGSYRYPGIVPAVGIKWLSTSVQSNLKLTSFDHFTNPGSGGPPCETDPNPDAPGAYNYMKGLKKDGSHWVVPPGGQQNITKFTYSGDPESGNGWNEGLPGNPHGSVQNCNLMDSGIYISVNPGGDRRFVMSSGSENYTVHSGDTNKIYMVQLIAQGTSRLNSVTKLKQESDVAQAFFLGGFIIGIRGIETSDITFFNIMPNYPNPFNPVTVITYELPVTSGVKLSVYDITGKEVAVLVNEKQNMGTYKVSWNADKYSSGVYFYKFMANDANNSSHAYIKTGKMILLK